MNTGRAHGFKMMGGLIAAFVLSPGILAQSSQSSQPSPQELIRRVVQNELNAEHQDNSHWMFRLETVNKQGEKEVDEVVQSKDGDVKRPLLINGRELPPHQRQDWDQQLGKDPQKVRKELKEKNQDDTRSQQMLKMLPDAFTFQYGERRGDLVQLNFKPNPKFRPRNHEAEVFHAMQGSVWVDEKQNRMEEISGRLMQRVTFAGGFLGHLDQGGTFDVKQEPVSPGYWEMTQLRVKMNGKALLFKTINVHQEYSRSAFKRVPDDLTIDQAAELLKRQPVGQAGGR